MARYCRRLLAIRNAWPNQQKLLSFRSPLTPASKSEEMLLNYAETQKALHALRRKTFSYPPTVAEHILPENTPHFLHFQLQASHSVIPLVTLPVNRKRKMSSSFLGLSAVPVYPVSLHGPFFHLVLTLRDPPTSAFSGNLQTTRSGRYLTHHP